MGLVANKRYAWKQMFQFVLTREYIRNPRLIFFFNIDDLENHDAPSKSKARGDLEDYGMGVIWPL